MKWPSIRRFGTLILLVVLTVGCQKGLKSDPIIVISGYAIGTSYLVKAVNNSTSTKDDLKRNVEAVMRQVDVTMSAFEETSELYQFNQYQKTDWFAVSPETFMVIEEAMRISEITSGAFDVTVGPLVDLWGFGPTERERRLPSDKEILRARALVAYEQLRLNDKTIALRKENAEMALDLAAIAKGYTVDRVAAFLDSKEFSGYLVEIGGEIRTKGEKPDKSPWLVAIERPMIGKRAVQKIVSLKDTSMATSGDYRNFFEISGQRYSHMLNPFTGRPVENNVASVTVVNPSCMVADALATALMVVGAEDGVAIADRNDIAALFIVRQGDILQEHRSQKFSEFLNKNEKK